MTILVTGGAGYIGSHTVRLLTEQGRDVVVLDTLELGVRERVAGVDLVQGDIASLKPEDVRKYRLGSVLAGGNSDPGGKYDATPAEWLALASEAP